GEVGVVVFKGREFSCSCSSAQCAECSEGNGCVCAGLCDWGVDDEVVEER
ncbi:12097_t:CDS:1, partial [Dentiscutata erythropus]